MAKTLDVTKKGAPYGGVIDTTKKMVVSYYDINGETYRNKAEIDILQAELKIKYNKEEKDKLDKLDKLNQ